RKLRETIAAKLARILPWQRITIFRQADSGSHDLLQAELAPFLLGHRHARDRSRNSNGLISDRAQTGNHVTLLVPIHVNGCGSWSLLAIVEEMQFAIGHANEHEAAA